MSRRRLAAAALLGLAGALPLLAVALGQDWYLDGPLVLLLAVAAGYAAGAWLPRWAAVVGGLVTVGALTTANQLQDVVYHPVDDVVFFLAVVGGPAAAGAAVTLRSSQVARLERLQVELTAQQDAEVLTARLEEQSRIEQQVHARLAERIAAIAVHAQGAQRSRDGAALAVIEDEARGVLDQLRSALGSLSPDLRHGDGPAEAPATPPEAPGRAEPADRPAAAPSTGLSAAARAWSVVPAADVVLSLGIGLALAVETAVSPAARGPWWLNVLAAVAVAAPLLLRREHPILAVGGSSLAGVLMSAWLTPLPATVTGVALLLVMFYSVGAWCRARWWVAGWAVAFLGVLGMEAVSGLEDDAETGDGAWIVVLLTVGAVAVGRVTAGWQERLRRTEHVVEELAAGRGAAVRLATAQERQALASELHDTVAHAMTVVCLQAGGQRRAGTDPDPADLDAVLGTISTTAAASLAELRDGLDAIEQSDHPLETSRIASIGRRMGVDLAVDAPATEPTGAAAALAFRVIREAVVNVARHAPGASAQVRVRCDGAALAVEVADSGAAGVPETVGSGRGLTGLRDAVRSTGGRLEWGPRPEGGFLVTASIPQEAS